MAIATIGYDEPNPGTRMIGFEARIPAHTIRPLIVYLVLQVADITMA